jgi:DNA-binding beta-propeller fold protein YncE
MGSFGGRTPCGGCTRHGSAPHCRGRSNRRMGAIVAATTLALSACGGFAEPALQPVTKMPVARVELPPVHGKTAAFDTMALDQADHRLYIADSLDQGVDVVDVTTSPGHYLVTVPLQAIPHGIALAKDAQRLYTGNDDSTVSVIDINPSSAQRNGVVATINTGGPGIADLVDYDPADHKLYVGNIDDGILSSIDVSSNAIVKQIHSLGKVEQPRYDPTDGMVYVASADRDSIIQVDPRSDTVVKEYGLPVKCVPHGIAINPATNQGVIGCSDKDSPVTIAWDFGAKRMIGTSDLAGAGDAVIFDAQAGHFFFAAASFAPAEIAVFNDAPIRFLTAVPTSHHSNAVAYDEAHRLIYTYDGKHLEAALWAFPDPVAGCSGNEAQRAADGAARDSTPHCHPGTHAVALH